VHEELEPDGKRRRTFQQKSIAPRPADRRPSPDTRR
jgi:hypothetical protein